LVSSTMAIFGTASGSVTVAVLAMWLGCSIMIVVAIVLAASHQPNFLGIFSKLLASFLSGSQLGVTDNGTNYGETDLGPNTSEKPCDTVAASKHPNNEASQGTRLKRFTGWPFAECFGISRRAVAPTPKQPVEVKTSETPGNPYFFKWTVGMRLKAEIYEIEELNPNKQPIGSLARAKGVGFRVTDGDRGTDLSIVIDPCGAGGRETPDSVLLKGVKGRRTSVVTETEHFCLHINSDSGSKEVRSKQAGLGLWFHSSVNKGAVVGHREGSSLTLKATSVPLHMLSAIFPVVLRFRVLRADALQAPEEVRLYCKYASGRVRILQVLMQLVPCE